MNKLKEKIERDTAELINRVTGFEETDVNFKLCKSYVDSNFKYHRYLDPDSHKIQRAIDGLCEKFEIHSEKQRAVKLKELTTSFLEKPGLGGKETGKSDVHFALLSLLIQLSDNPLSTEYVKTKTKAETEPGDEFDWKSYLLSDVDLNFISYASSSSDDESVEDNQESVETTGSTQDDPPIVGFHLTHDTQNQVISLAADHSGEVGVVYSQIERSVVVQYWQGKARRGDASGDHKSCQLSDLWHQHKATQWLSIPHCLVTEQQVIREILWMLRADTHLFILPFNGLKFILNPDIYMTHLTTECLENFLKPLMISAGQVHALRHFVEEVHSQVCTGLRTGEPCGISQTYQAFASWVFDFLTDFCQELVEIEKVVIKQETLITLLKLSNELQPWVKKVHTVYSVYIKGVCSQEALVGLESNCHKVSYLLNVMYQLLVESSLVSMVDTDKKASFVLEMLIASCWPLFNIISQWINYGQLCDPGNEFIVKRNKEVKSLDETFWEKAFVSNRNLSNRHPTANSSSTSEPVSSHPLDSIENIVSQGPLLLKSVLADIILIGKSMEMLENLGRMNEVHEIGDSISQLPFSFMELFTCELKKELHIQPSSPEKVPLPNESHVNGPQYQRRGVKQLLHMIGQKDPLLDMYFDTLFIKAEIKGRKQAHKIGFELAEINFTPISKLLESCLYPVILSRYLTVCSRLVHIFKVDYKLMDSIHAIQRYFLMSSGEVMYDFYTAVFHKIHRREEWREAEILDMFLHDALEHRYPDDVSRLSAVVVRLSSDSSPISLTNCIHLKYNVPWPVNVVISEKSQELYNNIFTFLMQMKRVKFSLEQLTFEDLSQSVVNRKFDPDEVTETVSRESKTHKCQLFRFRLLYFINSLHDYIMTRILHSTGIEFESELEKATDLEKIMTIHWNYVQVIHERCLLHPKLSLFRETIAKVFNLSLTLCQKWMQGIDFISYDMLVDMEVELSRCIHFLASFLNNVIKRGSFPHLASLAFSLSSSLLEEKKV